MYICICMHNKYMHACMYYNREIHNVFVIGINLLCNKGGAGYIR